MAFPFMLIPLIAGMAGQAAGGLQSSADTIEGAQTQAAIEAISREFGKEIFEQDLERQAPYYEAGTEKGLPLMLQLLQQGGMDQEQLQNMPLYNMQMSAGMQGLEQAGASNPFSQNYFTQSLGAAENNAIPSRLRDLLQFGLGSSESAGQGAQNYATTQAESLLTGGNVLAQGAARGNQIRRGMYDELSGQIGNIPSYMYRTRKLNEMGY